MPVSPLSLEYKCINGLDGEFASTSTPAVELEVVGKDWFECLEGVGGGLVRPNGSLSKLDNMPMRLKNSFQITSDH
jgi:hypothetical protein